MIPNLVFIAPTKYSKIPFTPSPVLALASKYFTPYMFANFSPSLEETSLYSFGQSFLLDTKTIIPSLF
jgi:hypothetical protein